MIDVFNTVELFAGGGGLALGLEKAGFNHILINEIDKNSCQTLKNNRPNWNVIEKDIKNINWKDYNLKNISLVSGGFPCQAFSHSGLRLGLEDTRGTLFYEFARCVKELSPICFLAENVKGLLTHDNGKTINVIIQAFERLGYFVFSPLLLNANDYEVAQKRERIFLFGVKKEFKNFFYFNDIPKKDKIILKDIFYKGKYYNSNVINNIDAKYSNEKIKYFNLIPAGGNWKDLPLELQKKYLGKMFYSEGGKTGILKRLSYNQPSVTILTSPSQKQTERCHPVENRPLNIRESARIQSFPDDWIFHGSIVNQYKQIGNAVPVNLAYNVGLYVINQLKNINKINFLNTI